MRRGEARLTDPLKGHERLTQQAYGAKPVPEIDDDARAAFGDARVPAADRPRITGGLSDGMGLLAVLDAGERLGLWLNEVDIDPLELDPATERGRLSVARVGAVAKAVYVNPGATTITRVGFAADPTLTATATNADASDGPWLSHATAASTGSASGVVSTFTVCRRDWLPDVTFRIKTPATLSNTRFWIGLFNQSPDASEATTGDHVAGFRYSTAVDSSGNWQAVTNDGGATPTVTDTGIARSASTPYTMRVRCAANSVAFYVNDLLVATHTADLPSAATLLGYAVRVTALANNARSILWGRVALSFT